MVGGSAGRSFLKSFFPLSKPLSKLSHKKISSSFYVISHDYRNLGDFFLYSVEKIYQILETVSLRLSKYTSNFVKITPLQVVFSTLFLVFGYPEETLSRVFDILLHRFCSISDPGRLKGCSAMAFSSTAVLLTWHSSSKDNGLHNKRNFSVREYVACTLSLWLRV